MARLGIFADVSNLFYCIRKKFDRKLDYEKFRDACLRGHELTRAIAYGAQENDEANFFIARLETLGYQPKFMKPKIFENPNYSIDVEGLEILMKSFKAQTEEDKKILNRADFALKDVRVALRANKDIKKADWDVGLALDVVRLINRIDIAVIGSADGDLAPLVSWVQDQQCYCVVYACNIARELREVADDCIEIEEHLLEERKVENG